MSERHFDGPRVRAVRRSKELTQIQVGQAVGVSQTAIANWEKGKKPDPEKLPALALALGEPLDALFPRSGPPDLADVRCDAGIAQYRTGELIGTRSHIPVSNAERGKRRLDEAFIQPLADGYGVTRDELLAAQERSFGNAVPQQPPNDVFDVPESLAEKIGYLLEHSYPGDQVPPSDADIARAVNKHAGALVISEDGVQDLRTGVQTTASPIVREGLGEAFGVSAMFFQNETAVARQVVEGLRLLATARQGDVARVAARGLGKEGLSADVLAFVNDFAQELQEQGLLNADGEEQ